MEPQIDRMKRTSRLASPMSVETLEYLSSYQRLLNRQSLCCAAAALIGFALVAYAFRR